MTIAVICMVRNLFVFFKGQGPPLRDIPLLKLNDTGLFCGNMAYAYELAAQYLSRSPA